MSEMINNEHLGMLKEVIGDDLKEILQTFLDSAPDTLSQIQQAVSSGSAVDLRLHAHTLKGSSANVGATQLSELSLVVENMAKEENVDDAEAKVAEISTELNQVMDYLQNYITSF